MVNLPPSRNLKAGVLALAFRQKFPFMPISAKTHFGYVCTWEDDIFTRVVHGEEICFEDETFATLEARNM